MREYSDMMHVRQLEPKDDAELSSFLAQTSRSNPGVLAYHSPWYSDVLTRLGVGSPFWLGLYDETDLKAVLPGFLRTDELGSVYSSLPYFGANGGVLTANPGSPIIYETLLEGLCHRLEDRGDMISASIYTSFCVARKQDKDTCGHRPQNGTNLPTDAGPEQTTHVPPDPYYSFAKNCVVVEKFTQYLDLTTAQWDKGTRYDVRRAAKKGVTIHVNSDDATLNAFCEIYEINCRDRGIPNKPRSAVLDTVRSGLDAGQALFLTARLDGVIIAGLLMLHSESTASYYIPCSQDEHRGLQPNMLLIDHAVQELRKRNVRWWNWESSPSRESGVYRFKKRWGSQESAYRIIIRPYRDAAFFRKLGVQEISRRFPWFFVYPFNRL